MTEQKDVLKRALDAIDTLTDRLARSEQRWREPIAVVGMSCRLPGGVNSPDEYWDLLREGRSGIREIPGDRWDVDAFYDPDPQAIGKAYTKYGGFMDSIDTFDAPFFGISPREAVTLDPQHRLLLECAWEALEDAGEAPDRLTNSATGVYVGITTSDYARLLREHGEDSDVYSASGTALNAAAGRISFALGLQGPCMAIDTACSSSLVAAHAATQALRARECDVALVGGVNVIASPDAFILFSRWGMIAPGPECRTFDADASGFVRGEGCGVIALKRLADAVADGNRIIAVIRGSAVNQDGPSSGLSVPNGLAQASVIRRALENSGVAPGDVGFIEAHGTGTIIGDPIEVEALGEVYGRGRGGNPPLKLGSVKPSIGHLESAAGVAGLVKLILTVQRGELPPQRNFAQPNPRIDWQDYPIEVVDHLQEWPERPGSRIGAVSAFGFSGTNAHMIVESVSGPEAAPASRAARVIPLSARTVPALRESAARIAASLDSPAAPPLVDVARTLSLGRAAMSHRAIVVGADVETVRARLEDLGRGEPGAGTREGVFTDRAAPRIAFIYTGQGAQYPGMGSGLRDAFPVFREAFDGCAERLRVIGGPDLLEILGAASGDERIHETGVTQPALFVLEYALTELFRSWGILPSVVLGHSVGEFTAACVAGVLSLDDALALIAERGRLMQSLPAGGGMLAVATDAATARDAIEPFRDRVSLAALNGPRDLVLSGELTALARIADDLRQAGIDNRPLTVSHAFHSPLMDPILDRFEAVAGRLTMKPPTIPLVSNLSGMVDAGAGADAAYWRRHVREPVAYEPSIRHLIDDGFRVFLELGPKPVLSGMARRFMPSDELTWAPTLRARATEAEDVLEGLGVLFTAGARPDWDAVLDGQGRRIALPTYPFQRRRHWIDTRTTISAPGRTPERPGEHPLLGERVDSPTGDTQFICTLDPERRPVLAEHRVAGSIVVPAAAYMEMASTAGAELFGGRVQLRNGQLRAALVLDRDGPVDVRLLVSRRGDDRATYDFYSRPASDDAAGWTNHAGGEIVRIDPAVEDATVAGWEGTVPGDLPVAADVDGYQTRMQQVGLEYGPSFRALVAARRGDGEAAGDLRLPEDDVLADRLTVHPGLLDAAFHLIGLALPDSDEDRFYLPVGFDTVDVVGRAGKAARAHVKLRTADAAHVVADVTVRDSEGRPVLRVGGLQVRAVSRAQFRAAIGATDPSPLLRVDWRALKEAAVLQGGDWIVVGGDSELAATVADQLHAGGAGATVAVGEGASPAALLAGIGAMRGPVRGIVDLRALDVPPADIDGPAPSVALPGSTTAEVIALLRAMASSSLPEGSRLVVATRGGQSVNDDDRPEALAGALWGVAATASAEIAALDLRLIDVDRGADAVGAITAAALRDDAETRLAARGAELFAPRLVPLARHDPAVLDLPAEPYTVAMRDRGTLEGLAIEPIERKCPGPGQVEIEVLASGLNFRDVLNLLDMYPGPAGPLGNECSGRIVTVGEGVEGLRIGDLVTCIADATLSSHVIADAAMTFPVPPELSVAQAAAFPIVQLTAYLALHQVGRMHPGDRVLIHAGAGGVGLAAVHLALAAGADVLASAGSEEKRAYLRSLGVREVFDSRNAAPADAVLDVTDGHGVDLLLNSLTGEFIDEGLRSLAAGGRFLEIGLRELRSDEQVREVRDDVSYHKLLLGDVCRTDPALVRRMYDTLIRLLREGAIVGPRTRGFTVAESPAAFRFMAKARHIGRVALVHPAHGQALARPDASYLVTGGLGALGLHAAEWLAGQNAGRVVLMGRSEPSAAAQARIDALRSQGAVEVEVVRGDIADPVDVQRILAMDRPPLRGVIHAAGVVDDAVLSSVDTDRVARALRPKADGAHHLLHELDGRSPDFLVLFSSGSALLGSPGQAAYTGANAAMDAMAQRARADGVAVLSVGWGAWQGDGMASTVDERTRREWTRRGIGTLTPERAFELLEEAMRAGLPRVAALPTDWNRFLAALPPGEAPALLRELGTAAPAARPETAALPEETGSFRDTLLALPPQDRMAALAERLRRETAAVLGLQNIDDLEMSAGLMEQGMDSLMAVELSGRLGRTFGVALPTTFAFEHPTLAALARHLIDQLAPAPTDATTPITRAVPDTDDDLDDLSDDDLEAELRRELDQAGF